MPRTGLPPAASPSSPCSQPSQIPLNQPPQASWQPCQATYLQVCQGRWGGGWRRSCRGGLGWDRTWGAEPVTSCEQNPAMASPGLLLLLLLTALPLLWSSSLPGLDTAEAKATIAGLILSALERATVFLEQRLPEINLDGIVGVRVLEEQLTSVQEKWAQEPLLQPLSLRVGVLREKLEAAIQRSLLYLKLSDPKYLREFLPTLQPGFWKLPHAWTHTNASLVYPKFEPQDSFSEESSDMCLVQLLGTGMDSRQPCGLSDLCRSLMTKPGCSGYCLSHQLLFFLWARMRGCTQGLFQQSQDYISLFCANMMDLNRRAEAIGYAYPTRDIFMENNAENEELSKAILYQQHFLRRVKRREKQFTDGCSSHNTATAVAALGGFLYILAEYPPANRELHPSTPSPPSSR
uniref:Chromosome 16 open reading frame 89 n=2 Tax=Callithrix jacchus TaxID=9483 RepID=F7A0M3_CALJA